MAVSRNTSKYTFTVTTTVSHDAANKRYKVVCVAKLSVIKYKFSTSNKYTVTLNVGGQTASGTITGTYGNNSSTVTYTIVSKTAYFAYSTSARTISITVPATADILSGGYGPGKCSYSSSKALAISAWTVAFNANGGEGAPASVIKYYGNNLTLPAVVPTYAGRSFAGWGTAIDSELATYLASGVYTANASITLYAVWEYATNAYLYLDGSWKMALAYRYSNGAWVQAYTNIYMNNVWRI